MRFSLQRRLFSKILIPGTIGVAFILILLNCFIFVPSFLNPGQWDSNQPNITIENKNNSLIISGSSDRSEIILRYSFPKPISLNLKMLDAFMFRMRFINPEIKNFRIQLISSNNQQDEYAEWELNIDSSRMRIDSSRLSQWQNYRLPIIWGKNINFDPTHITGISIIYYPSKPINGQQLEIMAPKVWSHLALPWAAFFNDPRAKVITTSYLNRTKLPIFRLNIPTNDLTKLNFDLTSGFQEVSGVLTTPDGSMVKVKVKNRGDTDKHFAYLKRSWRITFPEGSDYQGLKRLNFIIPEEIFYGTILPYQIAEQIGLMSPVVFPARLEINGVDYGAYPVVKQVDSILLAKYQRAKGFLYYGDRGPGEKFDPQNPLFESPLYWELYEKINWEPENGDDPLAKLLNIISLPQSRFENQIESILDIEKYLKWYALYQLFNSAHNDEWHNIKMFYDADSGKFEMIPWDVVPNLNPEYLDLDAPRYFVNNRLALKMLQVPKYLIKLDELYYQYGKEIFLSPAFNQTVDQIVSETKNDYLNDIFIFPAYKKNYENDLKLWREQIAGHVTKIVKDIEKPEFQICRLNNNNIILSTPAIFIEEKNNRLLVPKIIIQPVNNWLVELGSMHREQLTYEFTKHILPISSTIINPVTKQVVYQPDSFLTWERCK